MRSKEATERKLVRDRERMKDRCMHGEVLRFMGYEFESVAALRAVFPAFAGDDAIRAIRAGCQTVMEVETFCWRHRNGWMAKVRAGARALSKTPTLTRKARPKKRRKAA